MKEELSTLIQRYFDCTLSDTEEEQLHRRLASTTLRTPEIDEARAVMGISAAAPRSRKPAPRSLSHRWLAPAAACAAAVALVAGIAWYIHSPGGDFRSGDNCFAWVNGQKVTDEDAVVRQMLADLRELDTCIEQDRMEQQRELEETFSLIDDLEEQLPVEI